MQAVVRNRFAECFPSGHVTLSELPLELCPYDQTLALTVAPRSWLWAPLFALVFNPLRQGEVLDTMYFLLEGELMFTHKPPPRKPTGPRLGAARDPGTTHEDDWKPPEVPSRAEGFDVVMSPMARHKKFGAGKDSHVLPPEDGETRHYIMYGERPGSTDPPTPRSRKVVARTDEVDIDPMTGLPRVRDPVEEEEPSEDDETEYPPPSAYRFFGESFLTCSRPSDVSVTVKGEYDAKFLTITRAAVLEYLTSTQVG